jgi:hypothetical protein
MKKEKKKKRVVHIIKYLHEKFEDMKEAMGRCKYKDRLCNRK